METNSRNEDKSSPRRLRLIIALLALIASPLLCCTGVQLMAVFDIDFGLDFFTAIAQIENRTSETLYLTPITTTYAEPRVISQAGSIRQRDFPVAPGETIELEYDSADAPLAGIIVCRTEEDCRLLLRASLDVYQIDSYENLPVLEPGWLEAAQAHPRNDYGVVILSLIGLIPILLFGFWLYLGRRGIELAYDDARAPMRADV